LEEPERTTLVLGIGNTLLTDEGVGIHVVRHLMASHPGLPGVTYMDGGTLSFTLAVPIEEATNLIVVDAAQLHQPPGTLQVFVGEDMDRFLAAPRRSVHEVGLMDVMAIVRLTDRLPANRALIGVQPLSLDWGESPSIPVARAVPAAAAEVLRLIEDWTGNG
jgi:hydrogenase maturation protease